MMLVSLIAISAARPVPVAEPRRPQLAPRNAPERDRVAVVPNSKRRRIILVLTRMNFVSEVADAAQVILLAQPMLPEFINRMAYESRELLVENRVLLPLLLDYANGGVGDLVRHGGVRSFTCAASDLNRRIVEDVERLDHGRYIVCAHVFIQQGAHAAFVVLPLHGVGVAHADMLA